jgi:plastocyanin
VKKWTSILIACLALGLVAAGCGDDDDSSDSGSANTAAETAAAPQGAATAPASGEVVDVDIKDVKFNPKDLTIKKGETVKWTNSDGFPHDVTKEGGPGSDFKSKTLESGDTFEQTFDTAGKIDYLCTIHSGQTGTITVK